MSRIRTEPVTINLGPQHPSTHGVFRLRVSFDGEEKIANVGDTVFIPGGKEREIRNETNEIVIMTVVMPYPPKSN